MVTEMLNEAMEPLRALSQPLVDAGRLDGRIQAELDEGLTVREGCLFFVSQLHNVRGGSVADFGGPTGLEGFINKLPLDWLLDGADDSAAWLAFVGTEDWAARCLAQGILLGRAVVAAAADLTDMPVDIWIHVDHGPNEEYPSASFRFVIRREDDLWAGDLAGFEQPILRMTSGFAPERVGQ